MEEIIFSKNPKNKIKQDISKNYFFSKVKQFYTFVKHAKIKKFIGSCFRGFRKVPTGKRLNIYIAYIIIITKEQYFYFYVKRQNQEIFFNFFLLHTHS